MDERKNLGDRLRAGRPEPRSGLISEIVGRIPRRVDDRPRASLRLALALAMTVALVTAVAAVGGVGYASKQVRHAVSAVKSTAGSAIPSAKSAGSQYKGSPRVDYFQPKAACVGERIAIYGENFNGTTSVQMGGIPAKFQVKNDGLIHAWVPKGFTGGFITVTSPKGTGQSSNPLKLKHPGCSV